MRRVELACAALLLAAAIPAAPAALPAVVGRMGVPSLAPLVRRVSPAVVNVSSRGVHPHSGHAADPFFRRFFGAPPGAGEERFENTGSGVIVDARRGYILTNAHVVRDASSVTVTLANGHQVPATVVGSDRSSDVAVLEIRARGLTQLPIGDSARLRVGDFVLAIGNPFGLPHSVTSGIVSGLDRSGISPDGYEDYIQTDASINPGNSGGALVDLHGRLVGINTAILSRSGDSIGIGFAIPIDIAMRVMRQLIAHGSVRRGELGVTLYPVTPEVARVLGLDRSVGGIVAQVVPDSPAYQAGIRAGDVLTAVAGRSVRSNADLRNAIALLAVGRRVGIHVLRDGHPELLHAVLSDSLRSSAGRTRN
jgi:serine protease Do/serine protease DegQ